MRVIAVLETMWDWRQQTSRTGYTTAPRSFRINPENHSGKRLYKLIGANSDLLVTNTCQELVSSANHHGKPNPEWLKENLELLELSAPFDVLLICGRVAQATYDKTGLSFGTKELRIMHPAARSWTQALIKSVSEDIQKIYRR